MSNISMLVLAGSAVYLSSYLLQIPLSILSSTFLSFAAFTLFRTIWSTYLKPFYFNPLSKLDIPLQPSLGLQYFLRPYNSDQILEFMDTLPNDGFIRFRSLFNSEVVTLTEPKLVAEFLGLRGDHFIKRRSIARILENILGYGLVTAEGKNHKYQRKHLLPAFNFKVIRNLYPLFWSKATEMTSLIKRDILKESSADISAVIDVDDWAGRASLDIISKAGFGSDFEALAHPATDLNGSYRQAFMPNASSQRIFVLSMLTHPKLVNAFPSKNTTALREGVKAITKWIHNLIAERQNEMSTGASSDKPVHSDIISAAMESGAFTVENLVDQSKTLLGAGHETSATAITWGIYVLSQPQHSHIQSRLREEIRTHLPSPSSSTPITEEMLESLPYLEAVTKEILRLYPPAPVLGRVATSEVTIGGKVFPKGTMIQLHMWAINKSKELWGEDAREFKPDRWLVDRINGGAKESLAFTTFGHGPRGCIGRGFALAENKALLAQLIGSFDIKPESGVMEQPNISWGITARIIGGLNLKFTILEGW